MRRMMCLLALGLAVAGCASDDGGAPAPTATGTPRPTPTLRPDSVFAPVAPPLSPDDANHLGPSPFGRGAARARAAQTTLPTFDHWFYLVNGNSVPLATGAEPDVLMVNGAAPDGAPAPNGGVGVGVATLAADTTGRQLWKAIAATQDGYVYLRSAVGFESQGVGVTNFLTGGGPAANALDLGYLSSWSTAVYWNQAASPTGDNSGFQQWAYDSETAQLSNLEGGQLYDASPTAGVGSDTSAPGDQWYAFPNYLLEQVVAEEDSSPPFPTFPLPFRTSVATPPAGATPTPTPDAVAQQAAYDYLNQQFFPAAAPPDCTYGSTEYDGIRCEYVDLTATATLDTCAGYCLDQSAIGTRPPESLVGTVSSNDWVAVNWQIYQECLYAASVQNTFNAYNQIFTEVFLEDSDKVPGLANDVGVSASQSLSVVAIDFIEGILYTLLGATGDPAAGVFANMMSMGVNSVLAAGGQNADDLQSEIDTTVADLYTDLASAFEVLVDQNANGETAILSDWGRLQQIGPLTQVTGYNGLGLDADDVADVQTAAGKGYSLVAMQELLPLAYFVTMDVASLSDTWGAPSYAEFSYSTFGSNTQSYNVAFVSETGPRLDQYPSSTVMQTDIFDNGGNAFELFNAIDGWSSLGFASQNFSCYGAAATIYNATSTNLQVVATATQGGLAAPGQEYDAEVFPQGAAGPVTFQLPPYGYLPIWSVATGSQDNDMTIVVDVIDEAISTSAPVATFTYGSDGCRGRSPLNVWDVGAGNGYGFYPAGFNLELDSGLSQSLWVTVTN